MSKIIAVASGKGGVGKTLITATLAVALARKGYSVLAVDADMGLRNLDLLFGTQDDVFFDVFDLMKKRCKAAEAIIPLQGNIDFLPASQKKTWEKTEPQTFQYVVEKLSRNYDYTLIDCPPGRERAFKYVTAIADRILLVVEPTWTSLRDTGRVMQFCNKHKNFAYDVIFNNFYKDKPGYLDVGPMTEVLMPETIAGVLPHDDDIHAAAQEGMVANLPDTTPFYAALKATVNYLETGEEPVREEWEAFLPAGDGTPGRAERDGSATDPGRTGTHLPSVSEIPAEEAAVAAVTANIEKIAAAAEEVLQHVQTREEKKRLSVKTRMYQSKAWRQQRR